MKLQNLLSIVLTLGLCIHASAQDVSLEWVHSIGWTHNMDDGRAITTDAQGNVYVAGKFGDTVDFDPGPGVTNLGSHTSAAGNSEGFIAKYDTDGNLLWAKQTHTISVSGPYAFQNCYPNAIALDKQGNILISGSFNGGAVDFDPGPGVAELHADATHHTFVWKLDNDGNFIWAKRLGGSGENGSLAIDDSNSVYVTGQFSGTADFDPGTGTYNMTAVSTYASFTILNAFLCKLDKDGHFKWATQQPFFTGSTNHRRSRVALNRNGDVFLAGTFEAYDQDFDPGQGTLLLSAGHTHTGQIYISKWSTSGDLQWVKTFQNQSDSLLGYILGTDTVKQAIFSRNWLGSFTIDAEDNIFVGGHFSTNGPLRPDFDPGAGTFYFPYIKSADPRVDTMNYPGYPPIPTFEWEAAQSSFIVKLNSSAELIWAKEISGDTSGWIEVVYMSMVTDLAGNIYSAGYFNQGRVDFNPGIAIADTFYSMRSTRAAHHVPFILKLSETGNFAWAKEFISSGLNSVKSMSIGQSGSVYTTGSYTGIIDFDPGVDTLLTVSNGAADMFIHKMSCNDTTGNMTVYDTAVCLYHYEDTIYRESGTYYHSILQESGCNSTLTLELTIRPLEVSVSVNGFELSTGQPYSSYQWFLNGDTIPGATGATYTVTENGEYSVAVSNEEGCTGISNGYIINNVSVTAVPGSDNRVTIYPNPNNGQVFIQTTSTFNNADLRFTNLLGQTIINRKGLTGNRWILDISAQPAGIYFIEIEENGQVLRVKLVKE